MLRVFVFVYLCIFIVYLHVRHLGILFLMSWYNFLWKNIALVGSICKFDQTVFVYLCVCVFVFVYLVPQDSYKTNLAKKIPVCFLQLFCSGALNGLKSVKSVFPLILLILNFLTKQLWLVKRLNMFQSDSCMYSFKVTQVEWPQSS